MDELLEEDDEPMSFDGAVARTLVGKYVLIGVTVEDPHGRLKRHEEFHGTVIAADQGQGITLSLRGEREGQLKRLPPVTNVFEPALKGVYRLRDTGEEILDPDFTATWVVTEPDA